MKKILLVAFTALALVSCSENNNGNDERNGAAKLEYLKDNLADVGLSESLKVDPSMLDEIHKSLSEKTYEELDQLIVDLSREETARKEANAVYESDKFKNYQVRFEEARSWSDLVEVVRDYPDISQLTGLKKEVEAALQNDR